MQLKSSIEEDSAGTQDLIENEMSKSEMTKDFTQILQIQLREREIQSSDRRQTEEGTAMEKTKVMATSKAKKDM